MTYDGVRALELLRQGSQDSEAMFREDQEEAIRHVVERQGRLLVVQRTGWGKSFVYFIAAKLLREANQGPALLISPLLSLMRNQIAAARRMGLRAVTINSDNLEDWNSIEQEIISDRVDILLISPERLANAQFRDNVLAQIARRIQLLVIDEAHCISDWGHDFRPHYRLVERTIRVLPPTVRVLATTATANDRVMEDLQEILGPEIRVIRGPLHRPSLALQTITMPSQAERYAWLAEVLPRLEGSGIIYTLTKRDAFRLSTWLKSQGLIVEAYTGDSADVREELENALFENRFKALVATTALGMGYDKPDLAFVIHFQSPGSVVAYYQQVGRAGRGIDAAYGVLLAGDEDSDINDFFVSSAFPTPEEVHNILSALESHDEGLSVPDLLSILNLKQTRIDKALKLMALESPSPVVKIGSKWQLTAAELNESFWERAKRMTKLRREEQREMAEYVALQEGHMEFLVAALGGDTSDVTTPELPQLPTRPSRDMVLRTIEFLRHSLIEIAPRKRWPSGGMPGLGQQGQIDINHQAEAGRALCHWGDAGWGQDVRNGKYKDDRFSDELVAASAKLIRTWLPDFSALWVTCIPSLRHQVLVPEFARRLAESLGLPFHLTLKKTEDRLEQKFMQNSSQQARNVDGSLALTTDPIPQGPVLLIDDMVDSRWTMTVAAYLLRQRNCAAVYPFALAQTSS